MIPFAPGLELRTLGPQDAPAAAPLVSRLLRRAPYSRAFEPVELAAQLFDPSPPTMLPVRWQHRRLLGAWRAGELLGLADIAVGLDSESLDAPDYRPLGLLRFLALPARTDLVNEAAAVLLGGAHEFWRQGGVGYVKAYHISTGYPGFQAGSGMLPGDWADQVRALTEREFRFSARYYLLARPIDHLLEETVPQGGLSLAFRGGVADRRYQVFFRRTELIAEARLLQSRMQRPTPGEAVGEAAGEAAGEVAGAEEGGGLIPFAYIPYWYVDERWRNQKVGRWLLRRMVNDATQQGVAEIAVHLPLQQAAAINLLAQHGFVERNYRGYSFEKNLAE
jgi:ribosomal protein S18 acetylase RimI-like enzyme